MPAFLDELHESHNQMRRAEFDTRLLERVRKLDRHWRGLRKKDEQAYIQGRCVVAEALNYFGHYKDASEALSDESESTLESLTHSAPDGTLTTEDRALWKRRIWLVMALAEIRYREERYDRARELLDHAEHAIDILNPEQDGLLGTHSRHAYLSGQVARQIGRYDEAQRLFRLSAQWACKRFIVDTPFAEILTPVDTAQPFSNANQHLFDHSRLMANWTIGKVQALGLGWIDSTTGRLDSADLHLSAGYAMLRTTGDWIHRAYATLLIGVVARARAGTDPKMLALAIGHMDNAKRTLGSHPHRLRACYELSQAYLRNGEIDRARQEVATLLTELPKRPEPRQGRWRCNGIVVQSRIERTIGNFDDAIALAEDAKSLAIQIGRASPKGNSSEALIEASIALGEALTARAMSQPAQSKTDLANAIQCFENSRKLGNANPKTVAVCHLHLARARHLIGHTQVAKEEYSAWPARHAVVVEHGFIHRLADEVAREIRVGDSFYISSDLRWVETNAEPPDTPATAAELQRRLEEFLARRARELEGSVEKAAERLDVHEATVSRWGRSIRKKR